MSTTYAIQSKHRKHFLPFFFEVAVYTLENLSSQVYLSDAFFSRKRLVIQKEKSLHKMLSPVFLFPPRHLYDCDGEHLPFVCVLSAFAIEDHF